MNQERGLILAGGIIGAAGVALAAAAAHAGGTHLGTAANFLLFHAAVLLVVGSTRGNVVRRIGAWAILVGLLLFAGDLVALDALGSNLFPNAAPIGGFAMIGGWLVVAGSALSPNSD